MRIGITLRVTKENRHKETRDALSHDWVNYFNEILPDSSLILISNNLLSIDHWLSAMDLDALVLSNGNDIGEHKNRDVTEKAAISFAIKHKLPIIGFCRGMQMINEFFGGELTNNLKNTTSVSHVATNHEVGIIDQSFQKIFNISKLNVNSFHNQGITERQLAKNLKSFAVSPDKLVEGLVHEELPILAIQWHPERDNQSRLFNKKIIKKFLNQGKFW
tara:strand:+ start:503 stop:1156 length:654 start_codon:yes stop_codon:yes gene_type:complete